MAKSIDIVIRENLFAMLPEAEKVGGRALQAIQEDMATGLHEWLSSQTDDYARQWLESSRSLGKLRVDGKEISYVRRYPAIPAREEVF